MTDTETARRLVPLKEALAYGRFGKSKFYELVMAGKIKAYKRDRLTLVDLNTIDAYNASLPELRVHRVSRGRRRRAG